MVPNEKNEYQSCFRHYHVTFVQILECPKFHSDIPPCSPDKVGTRLIATAAVATRGRGGMWPVFKCGLGQDIACLGCHWSLITQHYRELIHW